MSRASPEKVGSWIAMLTNDQKTAVIASLLEVAQDSGIINFHDDADHMSPAWDGDGSPLVDGQTTWLELDT